jgi:hypothetical protein
MTSNMPVYIECTRAYSVQSILHVIECTVTFDATSALAKGPGAACCDIP